jgi:hypothetical protein
MIYRSKLADDQNEGISFPGIVGGATHTKCRTCHHLNYCYSGVAE